MKKVLILLFFVLLRILDPSTAVADTTNSKFTANAASPSIDDLTAQADSLKSGSRFYASGLDLKALIPEFMGLVDNAARRYNHGVNEGQLTSFILTAAQPKLMNSVEREIPGWKAMARLRGGETLVHIVRALIALDSIPEYRNAIAVDKSNMQLAVLLHDLAKRPVDPITGAKIRDAIHPFRSAVLAAEILPNHGFYVTDQFQGSIESWSEYTNQAVTTDSKGRPIHGNAKLPGIITGIDEMFERNSATSIIVKSILFHQSLNLLKEWPDAAPLTDWELKLFINDDLLKVLGPLVRADSASWQLFKPENRKKFDQQIEDRIKEIKSLIRKP